MQKRAQSFAQLGMHFDAEQDLMQLLELKQDKAAFKLLQRVRKAQKKQPPAKRTPTVVIYGSHNSGHRRLATLLREYESTAGGRGEKPTCLQLSGDYFATLVHQGLNISNRYYSAKVDIFKLGRSFEG